MRSIVQRAKDYASGEGGVPHVQRRNRYAYEQGAEDQKLIDFEEMIEFLEWSTPIFKWLNPDGQLNWEIPGTNRIARNYRELYKAFQEQKQIV